MFQKISETDKKNPILQIYINIGDCILQNYDIFGE